MLTSSGHVIVIMKWSTKECKFQPVAVRHGALEDYLQKTRAEVQTVEGVEPQAASQFDAHFDAPTAVSVRVEWR